MAERPIQPTGMSEARGKTSKSLPAWKIFVLSNGKSYRVVEKSPRGKTFPSLIEYMGQVDMVLVQNDLAPRERIVARAFALAVYRRAFARKLRIDVESTAVEAIARARLRINKGASQKSKKSTYEYESKSAGRIGAGRKRRSNRGGAGED